MRTLTKGTRVQFRDDEEQLVSAEVLARRPEYDTPRAQAYDVVRFDDDNVELLYTDDFR